MHVKNSSYSSVLVKFACASNNYITCMCIIIYHLQQQDEVEEEIAEEADDDDDDDIKELEPPKVLGDVLESVAGALFVDSQMNLEVVWSRFYPFFKPLIGKSTIICDDIVHSLQNFVLLVDFIGLCMHSK